MKKYWDGLPDPKPDHLYVVKVYSTSTHHFIKVGKSQGLEDRMKTYKSICPELKLICRGVGREGDFISALAKTFKKAGQEVFKIPIEDSLAFIWKVCELLDLKGTDNVNSVELTGCSISHYRTQPSHWYCPNTCKEKQRLLQDRLKHGLSNEGLLDD